MNGNGLRPPKEAHAFLFCLFILKGEGRHLLLATAIQKMHLFCAHLGLLYRKHHAVFPWLYQRREFLRRDQSHGFPVAKSTPRQPPIPKS